MKTKYLLFILMLGLLAACEPKIDEFKADANGVDFSRFVAVGNSLTAGMADGALYKSGQEYSIPNIIAGQLKYVGGGDFIQPLMASENGVGIVPNPNAPPYFITCFTKRVLDVVDVKDCNDSVIGTTIKPVYADPSATQDQLLADLFAPPTVAGPYNNVGVPGAALQHLLLPQYAAFNPYYQRFNAGTDVSMVQYAASQEPSFVFLWIGNNDVLQSALMGTNLGITPVDTFALYYPLVLASLLPSGVPGAGVVGNIPDVTSIPYFTTIQLPFNEVILDQEQALGLTQLYALYGHPEVEWQAGANSFVIETSSGTWRFMEPGDLFLLTLPVDSIKCKNMGVAHYNVVNPLLSTPWPIPNQFVLDKGEQAIIQQAIDGYNEVIRQTVETMTASKIALADVNSFLKSFIPTPDKQGLIFDGVTFNVKFIEGGTFSTDGVHLSPRGNALAANYFIDAINQEFGCTIPKVSVTRFPGIIFP